MASNGGNNITGINIYNMTPISTLGVGDVHLHEAQGERDEGIMNLAPAIATATTLRCSPSCVYTPKA